MNVLAPTVKFPVASCSEPNAISLPTVMFDENRAFDFLVEENKKLKKQICKSFNSNFNFEFVYLYSICRKKIL